MFIDTGNQTGILGRYNILENRQNIDPSQKIWYKDGTGKADGKMYENAKQRWPRWCMWSMVAKLEDCLQPERYTAPLTARFPCV